MSDHPEFLDQLGRDLLAGVPALRRRRRRRRLAVAGAVMVAAVTGSVVLLVADGDPDRARVATQQSAQSLDGSGAAGQTAVPETDPPTTTEQTDPWAFDITYIDVDAGNAVAASEEFAWVAGSAAPVLSTIDLATNQVIATTPIPPEAGAANYGFGSVWINHDDGWVTRFDPVRDEVVARIEVGGEPTWIEPGVDSVWLGTGSDQHVVRIDPETNTVVARIDVGGERAGAPGQNEAGVWVGGTDQVTRIDPVTNAVVATIEVPGAPGGLMVSPDAVWVPGRWTGVVHRIDPATNTVSATIDVAAAVGEPVATTGPHYTGGTIWIRYHYDCADSPCRRGVARIDPATNTVVATADLRPGWSGGATSVGPTTAWTVSDDAVARFDFE